MTSSCAVVDNSFGPHAGDCRGGFDLTLLFEESILVLPLLSLLLLAAPGRLVYLLRKGGVKVERNYLLHSKLVCFNACVEVPLRMHAGTTQTSHNSTGTNLTIL
jgi:hypothetical protein